MLTNVRLVYLSRTLCTRYFANKNRLRVTLEKVHKYFMLDCIMTNWLIAKK